MSATGPDREERLVDGRWVSREIGREALSTLLREVPRWLIPAAAVGAVTTGAVVNANPPASDWRYGPVVGVAVFGLEMLGLYGYAFWRRAHETRAAAHSLEARVQRQTIRVVGDTTLQEVRNAVELHYGGPGVIGSYGHVVDKTSAKPPTDLRQLRCSASDEDGTLAVETRESEQHKTSVRVILRRPLSPRHRDYRYEMAFVGPVQAFFNSPRATWEHRQRAAHSTVEVHLERCRAVASCGLLDEASGAPLDLPIIQERHLGTTVLRFELRKPMRSVGIWWQYQEPEERGTRRATDESGT